MKSLNLFVLAVMMLFPASLPAQQYTYGSTPALHVDGNVLKDPSGGTVVLHGVMDTPNPYFNSYRWGQWWGGFNDEAVARCRDYFDKITTAITQPSRGTYCNLFRLHLDPCWTNDPNKQATAGGAENDISRFSADRLRTYLNSLYIPIALNALSKGLYVIIRPPGVFPQDVNVGGEYNQYLMTVWDIVSSNATIKQYSGQISLELGNEPVNVKNQWGQTDAAALHDFFQPIVNKIRQNGFNGILWIPGTGWQSNYQDYVSHPITGNNIGYAVHNYVGWYNGNNSTPYSQVENYINQFHTQVPVIDTNPIVITEVDWSPEKEGAGHYDEHGNWVVGNFGTWATGTTSNWGHLYKALLDRYGTISMTLSGTDTYLDVEAYLNNGTIRPAYTTDMQQNGFSSAWEACSGACFEWYKQWAQNVVVSKANFNPDPVTGRYVASFNDFVTGGDLQFDRNSGLVTLPAGKTGSLSISFNQADFSDVTQVRLSCDQGDVFDVLSVNKTDGTKVHGGDYWSSKYLLNFDEYQSEGGSIASLVWTGTNNTSETKTMNIRQLLVQVDVMRAGKKHEQEIDRWAFGIWDGTGAGATRQGNDDAMEYNVGQCIAGYGTIYGNNSVLALNYADLTRYSKLRVYGDDGVHIRALFNRSTDTSSDFVLKEGDITDGVFEIDLSSVGSYAHLNALKVGAGTGAAWRVMVVDDNDVMDYHLYGKQYVEGNLAEALSDRNATNYDATALKNPSAVALNTANKNALIYVSNASRLSNAANVVVKNGDDYTASNIVLTDGESDAANVADAYLAGGTTENCTWKETNGNWTFEWDANTSSAWVEIMHWVNLTESQKGTQYKYLMVDTEEFTEKWGVSFLDGDGNTLATQGYWNPMSAGASTTKIIDIDALFAAAGRSGDRSKLTKIRLFNVETTNAGKVVVKRAYLYNEAGDCVYPFFAPYDIAAQNATLNTVVPQGGFTTLTIPFVASLPGGYTSHALLADNVLQFDWVDANRPIVLQGQEGTVSLTASNTTVKATEGLEAGVLKGTYRTTSVAAGNYVQGASGSDAFSPVEGLQFAAVASGAEPTLLPFRAYATAKVVTTEPDNPEPDNPEPENPEPENPEPDNPEPENPEPDNPVTPDPVEPDPTAEPFTLTVSSAGVATLYLGFDAVIPTDVDFFAVAGVTDLQGSVAYLKEVKGGIIPANTGLMIFANPGTYTLVPSTVAATEKVESKLHGVLVDTPIETLKANEPGFNIFVLSRGVTELTGFKPAGSTIKHMTANKAYFPMPADSEVKMVTFSFGGNNVTGIEDIKAALTSPASNDIFDLSGRRVSNPTKGIYIINGKKVLIK